tara:strand:- start:6847 stop:7107 length:261 start_codon:yes stop_codon:yes gene_type:complete
MLGLVFEKVIDQGQIGEGDHLIMHTGAGIITAVAREVINNEYEHDVYGEEIVYNRSKNHYFITSMVVRGESWVKEVYVAKIKENES